MTASPFEVDINQFWFGAFVQTAQKANTPAHRWVRKRRVEILKEPCLGPVWAPLIFLLFFGFFFLWQTEHNMIQVPKEIFNHTERERKLQNGMGLLCDAVTRVHPELCLKLEEKCQLIWHWGRHRQQNHFMSAHFPPMTCSSLHLANWRKLANSNLMWV